MSRDCTIFFKNNVVQLKGFTNMKQDIQLKHNQERRIELKLYKKLKLFQHIKNGIELKLPY